MANCESYNMIGVGRNCVAPCPQSYAISVSNGKVQCMQRCPLNDLRYVYTVLEGQKIHMCVDASESSKYKYYRELKNGTKLMVKACDAGELKTSQQT